MSCSRVYPRTAGGDLVVGNVVTEVDISNVTSNHPMQKDEHESVYALPIFQASMFATILEDAITQIRILAQCNHAVTISMMYADMQLLLAIKFGVEQPKVEDDLDLHRIDELDSEEKKMDKLSNDRKYFAHVCLDAYKDLTINNSYEGLVRHVTAKIDLDLYRAGLVEEEAKHRLCYKEVRKHLRQHRNHITSVIYDMDANIENLRSQTEDCEVVDGIATRYVEGWQRARTEQNNQVIYYDQLKPITSINYYKKREEHEQRIHSEIEIFTNITINETLDKIEAWMEKHEVDVEAIEAKIRIQKNKYMDMRERRVNLEETMVKNEQMITDWIVFKEERARRLAYSIKMNKSAITVQAWWRGLLVRRCLGPYKIKKQKRRKH